MSYIGAKPVPVSVGGTGSATGAITASSGDITVSTGDIIISTAAKGVSLGGGAKVICGTGAPSAVTAPKGSLYLRLDGGGVNDRAYINTDSGTTWTAIVTVG